MRNEISSRRIIFRGKSLDKKKWVYGYLVLKDGISYIGNESGAIKVDGSTVGQFTGRVDSKANDIYEGDILHNTLYRTDEFNRVVKFFYGSFVGELIATGRIRSFLTLSLGNMEVIGTIHGK